METVLHAGLPVLPLVLRCLTSRDMRALRAATRRRRSAAAAETATPEAAIWRRHLGGRVVGRFMVSLHRSAPWRNDDGHPLDVGPLDSRRMRRWMRAAVGHRYDRHALQRFVAQDAAYRRRPAAQVAEDLLGAFPGMTVAQRARRQELAERARATGSRWPLVQFVGTMTHFEIVSHGI
jgi:hypothetical protein